MALITKDNIKKLDKDRNSVHSKVRATYTTFTSDGKKYFQIDTYGSPTREMKNKISQSIQVDKEMAKEMIPDLISQGEGVTIEFKECKNEVASEVYPTVCSFSNRFSGHILMGVSDNGETPV